MSYRPQLIERNFPELFREEYPKLIEFIAGYYKFLEQNTEIYNLEKYFDIDALKVKSFVFNTNTKAKSEIEQIQEFRKQATAEFDAVIGHYLNQYGFGFPAMFRQGADGTPLFPGFSVNDKTMGTMNATELNNQASKFGRERIVTFLRNATAIYLIKGTQDCLIFLFRFLFNEIISLSYPKERILRASESTWVRYAYIEIEVLDNYLPMIGDTISWTMNSPGTSRTENFVIDILDVLPLGNRRFSIKFNINPKLKLDSNNLAGGVVTISRTGSSSTATINQTLDKIIIPENGRGKFWFTGKAIRLNSVYPGTASTDLIVTAVDDATGLKVAKILNRGAGQVGHRPITVSPLPERWFSGKPELSFTEDTSGNVAYVLKIAENADLVIDESVYGLGQLNDSTRTYIALEDNSPYTQNPIGNPDQLPYVWDTVLGVTVPGVPRDELQTLNYSDWMASQTTLIPVYSWIATDAGRYEDGLGHLSDEYSVLQDNFMFQEFSYIVESSVPVAQALQAIEFNHPAGLKYFFNSVQVDSLDFHVDVEDNTRYDPILLFDAAKYSEEVYKNVTKPLRDDVFPMDSMQFFMDKTFLDIYDTSSLQDTMTLESYFEPDYIDNSYFVKYISLLTH